LLPAMTRKQSFRLSRYLPILFVLLRALASSASADGSEKVLYSFLGGTGDGAYPAGGVVFDKAGNLYGATTDGGGQCVPTQCGTVFQLAPPAKQGDPWTETVLYIFKGNGSGDGNTPAGSVIIDSAGNLYGTTGYGGTGDCVLLGTKVGCGTVYELSPPAHKGGAWTETVLYSFPTPERGYLPNGNLVFDSAGNLYGATMFGGGYGTSCNDFFQYCGEVFELSPPKENGGKWTEKVLHGFKGPSDGANPNGGLIFDSKGAIYGTTSAGGYDGGDCGAGGCGTVFVLKPPSTKGEAWTEAMLHRFDPGVSGAAKPMAGVIFDRGSLYGTTLGGESSGQGTIFELFPRSNGRGFYTAFKTAWTEVNPAPPWCSTRGATYMGPRPVVGVSEVELFFACSLLVCCPGNTFTKSLDLGEDRVGGCRPNERPGVLVVILYELIDLSHQFLHAAKSSAPDGSLGNSVEPDLHLIEPGGVGWSEVHMKARPRRQPALHARMLVGGVIVYNHVHL
jgi:uncharacterized repeat protein (TIGR03803 family)